MNVIGSFSTAVPYVAAAAVLTTGICSKSISTVARRTMNQLCNHVNRGVEHVRQYAYNSIQSACQIDLGIPSTSLSNLELGLDRTSHAKDINPVVDQDEDWVKVKDPHKTEKDLALALRKAYHADEGTDMTPLVDILNAILTDQPEKIASVLNRETLNEHPMLRVNLIDFASAYRKPKAIPFLIRL